MDMSRMPLSDMLSVRGMGVAERDSTFTVGYLSFNDSLCATPKRCSSSSTSSPRSANSTFFESTLWVAMTIDTLPSFMP